ncbi:MAG: phenylalanine--tRNA ligase subunit alpha [Erysipelothrix sp.]|nr:phenylalanine--tRNA ligase subunit alpha [Erysipelothrix sp.]
MTVVELKNKAKEAIINCISLEELKEVYNQYLSKKGEVSGLMSQMRNLPNEEKPAFGQMVNDLKNELETLYKNTLDHLNEEALNQKLEAEKIDLTLPATNFSVGQRHPLVMVQRELEDIYREMGDSIVEGLEIELDLYNFERANIPKNHPARDMQDTFFITEETLLRTHTTAIQTRALEMFAPNLPIKVVCPGKVYRKDDDDATHSNQFVQMEALVVGHGITLADLKGTLELLAKRMFGNTRTIRFRPSYFQFTEPSVEVDVSCHICDGKGCSICKNTGWIEILGAGMVHPEVLKMAGYKDPTVTGFAFGLGVERVAMLKYGIDDIRHFYTNDSRFLKQFKKFD